MQFLISSKIFLLHFIFYNLRIGSILALSTSSRAGGEADQGQRSGKKNVLCGCVTFVHTLFIGLGFTFKFHVIVPVISNCLTERSSGQAVDDWRSSAWG